MSGAPDETSPERAKPQDARTELASRSAVFEHSYDEVLSALKHQDDKLGRGLTAQAFLTAAGITIFTQLGTVEKLEGSVTLDGATVHVPTFLFSVFLVSIAVALTFTLAAIGPSTPYKGTPEDEPSLLFYAAIRGDREWSNYFGQPVAELEERLARNFHREAEKLSHRVHYKVTRAREAAAFLTLALASLALLGIFALRDVDVETRWRIATFVLLGFTLFPLWDLFHMWTLKFPEGRADPLSYALLLGSATIAVVLSCVAPAQDARWSTLIYLLGIVLASRLGLLRRTFSRVGLGFTVAVGLTILGIVMFVS